MVVQEFINKIGFQVDQASLNNVNQQFNQIKSMATKALGAIGIGLSLGQLNAIAEEFNAINDRINYAVGFSEDMKDVQKEILNSANECKQSYSQMADAVVSLKQANEEVFPVSEATEFVEYINKLGMSAGYSQGEISSMMNSIQRMTAYGTVSAQMLNRMAMQTPALIEQIIKSLGITREELDQMAANGEVTAETIKEAILNSKDDIDHAFSQLDYSISDALLNIRNKWGYFVDDVNASTKITQTLAQGLVAGFDGFMVVMNVVGNGIKWFIGLFDDTAQALRFVAVLAGALLIAFNWTKIVAGAKMLWGWIVKLFTTMGGLKQLGIAAAILAAYLIIEDFVYFLQGNESVIGDFFDYIGVGADNARQAIFGAFNKVKEFLLNIFGVIQQGAGMFVDAVKGFFEQHGSDAEQTFLRYWGVIKTFLTGVWTFISQLASVIFGDTEDTVDGSNRSMSEKILGIWQKILGVLSSVFGAIFKAADTWFNALLSVVESVFGAVQSFWEAWGPTVIGAFATVWEGISGIFGNFLDIVENVANFINSVFTGDWEGAWEAVKSIFEDVWDSITGFFGTIIDVFSGIFHDIVNSGGIIGEIAKPFAWAFDAIKAVWDLVTGFFSDIFSAIVGDASLGEILEAISSPFKTAWEVISGIWEAVTGFFAGIFGGIAGDSNLTGMEGTLSNPFTGAWDTITGVLGNAASQVAEWFSGIDLSSAASAVSSFASDAWNDITETFSDVTGWFSEKFSGVGGVVQSALSEVGTWASNAWESIKSGAGKAAGWLAEAVGWGSDESAAASNTEAQAGAAGESAKRALVGAFSGTEAELSGVFSGISSMISGAISSIISIVQTGFQDVGGTISTSMGSISFDGNGGWQAFAQATLGGMNATTSAVRSGMTSASTTVNSSMNGIRQVVSMVMSSLPSAASSGMSGFVSAISSGMGIAIGVARSGAYGIKSAIQEVSLYGSGEDMMRGLRNGIESMRDSVVGTARSIAQEAKNAVNSALDVASPSKEMIKTGRFTGEGLVIGMENQKGNVESAAEESLAQPVLTMGQKISNLISGMRSFAQAAAVSTPTSNIVHGSTYNSRSVSQNVNINNTFNGERAFQTSAAGAMNQAATDITETLARGLAYAR